MNKAAPLVQKALDAVVAALRLNLTSDERVELERAKRSLQWALSWDEETVQPEVHRRD